MLWINSGGWWDGLVALTKSTTLKAWTVGLDWIGISHLELSSRKPENHQFQPKGRCNTRCRFAAVDGFGVSTCKLHESPESEYLCSMKPTTRVVSYCWILAVLHTVNIRIWIAIHRDFCSFGFQVKRSFHATTVASTAKGPQRVSSRAQFRTNVGGHTTRTVPTSLPCRTCETKVSHWGRGFHCAHPEKTSCQTTSHLPQLQSQHYCCQLIAVCKQIISKNCKVFRCIQFKSGKFLGDFWILSCHVWVLHTVFPRPISSVRRQPRFWGWEINQIPCSTVNTAVDETLFIVQLFCNDLFWYLSPNHISLDLCLDVFDLYWETVRAQLDSNAAPVEATTGDSKGT